MDASPRSTPSRAISACSASRSPASGPAAIRCSRSSDSTATRCRWIACSPRRASSRPIVCGVSYGGLIALRVRVDAPEHGEAARAGLGTPSRLPAGRALRLPTRRAPVLLFPVFLLASSRRVSPELHATFPRLVDRARFAARQGVARPHGARVTTPDARSHGTARGRRLRGGRAQGARANAGHHRRRGSRPDGSARAHRRYLDRISGAGSPSLSERDTWG